MNEQAFAECLCGYLFRVRTCPVDKYGFMVCPRCKRRVGRLDANDPLLHKISEPVPQALKG